MISYFYFLNFFNISFSQANVKFIYPLFYIDLKIKLIYHLPNIFVYFWPKIVFSLIFIPNFSIHSLENVGIQGPLPLKHLENS
jgi:hypothetical protein